jgi:hypothetical protein
MPLKSFLISIYTLFFLTLFIFVGCKKPKDSAISVNDKQSLGTYYLDTFSASLSTVLIDSLPTSIADKMLIGSYTDTRLGTFTAASYLQFSLAGIDLNNDKREDMLVYTGEPLFDSLVLEMTHIYTYGDTTSPHIMQTYRLTEDMQPASGTSYIYNGQTFVHETSALALNNIRYSSANGQKLRVRMDTFGLELFNYAKDNDNRVATNDAFKTYFKGLALLPDAANKSVFGYGVPFLRLYYHDSDNPTTVKSYSFKHVANTDLFFNQMKNNRTSTNLASLKNIYQEIDATLTNNESYVMTGVELMTKIKFPYLNAIKAAYPNFAVNKAELIIHPKMNTYNPKFRLPTELVLYTTNQTNIAGAPIAYTGTSVAEVINPVVDYESNFSTYYKFEVTDFIQDQLKTSFYNGTALMLASPRSYSGNRTEKLVLDNNPASYTITLKLYLTIF